MKCYNVIVIETVNYSIRSEVARFSSPIFSLSTWRIAVVCTVPYLFSYFLSLLTIFLRLSQILSLRRKGSPSG